MNALIFISNILANDISCIIANSNAGINTLTDNLRTCLHRTELLSGNKGKLEDFMLKRNQLEAYTIKPSNIIGQKAFESAKPLKFFFKDSYDKKISKLFLEAELEFLFDKNTLKQISVLELQQAIEFLRMVVTFLKVSSLEYGTRVFDHLNDSSLANSSQWWAYININDFSLKSIRHAEKMLHTTKQSSNPSQLNGASALFPTNITFANLIYGLKRVGKEVTDSSKLIHKVIGKKTLSKMFLPKYSIFVEYIENVASLHDMHIGLINAYRLDRFISFQTGYYNVWRYTNNHAINYINKK